MSQKNSQNNDILIETIDGDIFAKKTGSDILTYSNGDLLLGNADGNLISKSSNDKLRGGRLNDFLQGGSGDDQLSGNLGNDTVNGELGNDTLFGGRSDGSNNDSKGADILNGDAGDDLIFGNGGDDQLFGNTGTDILVGGKGNDTLNGGIGNDILSGDKGDDRLIGEIGADTLTGASGNDTFVIGLIKDIPGILSTGGASKADADYITDFVKGTDKIEILGGLTFEQLNIFEGNGEYAGFSIIQETVNGQYLANLRGIASANIERSDFVGLVVSTPIPENNAPTADTIASQTALEDTAFNFTIPVGTFTDPDAGDILTYSATLSDGSALPSWLQFNPETGTFAGTPANENVGILTVKVTATDTSNSTVSSNFELVVTNVNDEPVAVDDILADTTVLLNTGILIQASTLLENDTDVENNTLTVTSVSNPINGTVSLTNGVIKFNPTATGTASFTYTISDGNGGSGSATTSLNITSVNTVNLSNIVSGTNLPIGAKGFVINGEETFSYSGVSVNSAGDVNGDGLADLIVGAFLADSTAGYDAGKSYLVFGKTDSMSINLNFLGTGGFIINGEAAYDYSSDSVSNAGDVNGDGLADFIIGAYRADPAAVENAGKSYLVFGKTDSTSINLSSLGTGGFIINGEATFDYSGTSVSSAGDVNGDGLADLIIGASRATSVSASYAGKSYVVFGKTDTAEINLSSLGTGGFIINGEATYDNIGVSVSNAGDVNGDGLADLIIGAPFTTGNAAGKSYLVFGKTDATSINLSSLDTGGFIINGETASDNMGWSVSNAGDVNGDGLADLIVGSPGADPGGLFGSGKSYVVFGKTDTAEINLSSLGTGGFIINGEAASDSSGVSVSSAGDVNGDGLADLIVGSPGADPASGSGAGKSYLVFGKTDATSINLSSLGTGGFIINGEEPNDWSGVFVSSAGDVNGDGFADLIVGAFFADPVGVNSAGKSYVIFGGDFTGAVTQLGNDVEDTLTGTANNEALVGAVGDDILSDGGFTNILMYGGTGNDFISINNANFRRLDGGLGNDTLLLAGTGITLNLTGTSDNTKIASFETIDLTGIGNNTLTLSHGSLLKLVEETRANGGFNRLTVRGDNGDIITANLTGFGFTSSVGASETTYTKGNLQLVVENDINQIGIVI